MQNCKTNAELQQRLTENRQSQKRLEEILRHSDTAKRSVAAGFAAPVHISSPQVSVASPAQRGATIDTFPVHRDSSPTGQETSPLRSALSEVEHLADHLAEAGLGFSQRDPRKPRPPGPVVRKSATKTQKQKQEEIVT